MRLGAGHRVVIALTGFAVGLRVLMPIHAPSRFGLQIDVAATLLQVVGVLLLGAAVFFILPSTWGPTASRRMVTAGLTLGWLLTALVFAFGASQTGFALSLERTNWPLTTAGAVVASFLSSLTWGLVRNRSAWIGLRMGLAASLLVVLVGAGLTEAQQWHFRKLAYLHQKQEAERRQAEALRTRVIEGEQIGALHLGASVDELRVVFRRTFSSVERTRTGLVQYDWCCDGLEGVEDWWVFVDPKVERSIGLSLTGVIDWDPKTNQWEDTGPKLPYETTKGIRFGHSSETVSAVYGPPSKTYIFDYGRASFFYAPLRTEFEFVCKMTKVQRNTRCEGPSLRLDRITIFAPGWSTETLWGPGGRY